MTHDDRLRFLNLLPETQMTRVKDNEKIEQNFLNLIFNF